jgi:hypothetical protein
MHSKAAMKHGATAQRVHAVAIWHQSLERDTPIVECSLFDRQECSALSRHRHMQPLSIPGGRRSCPSTGSASVERSRVPDRIVGHRGRRLVAHVLPWEYASPPVGVRGDRRPPSSWWTPTTHRRSRVPTSRFHSCRAALCGSDVIQR